MTEPIGDLEHVLGHQPPPDTARAPKRSIVSATSVHGMREANPELQLDIKRVIAAGDMVATPRRWGDVRPRRPNRLLRTT